MILDFFQISGKQDDLIEFLNNKLKVLKVICHKT